MTVLLKVTLSTLKGVNMQFKWRHKTTRCGEEFAWTYKRNYKVDLRDMDGDMYEACITETTTNKTVFRVFDSHELVDMDRAEDILKALAKGQSFEPTVDEKSAYKYEFYPENINYMEKTPYELEQAVKNK